MSASALIHDDRQLDLIFDWLATHAASPGAPASRPTDLLAPRFSIWCDPASGLMEVVRAGHMPTLPREIGVVGGAA
jgi:hypothetical protein